MQCFNLGEPLQDAFNLIQKFFQEEQKLLLFDLTDTFVETLIKQQNSITKTGLRQLSYFFRKRSAFRSTVQISESTFMICFLIQSLASSSEIIAIVYEFV
jgi:hypothetical protein